MTIGYPAASNDINSRAGGLAVAVREALRNVQLFKAWLDTQPDTYFTGLGYSQTDVNNLRSAFVDLNDLANLYAGAASSHLTGTYDYRTFAKLMTGVV